MPDCIRKQIDFNFSSLAIFLEFSDVLITFFKMSPLPYNKNIYNGLLNWSKKSLLDLVQPVAHVYKLSLFESTPDEIFFTTSIIQMVSYVSVFSLYFSSLLMTECIASVHLPLNNLYILLILDYIFSSWSMGRLIYNSFIFTRTVKFLLDSLSSAGTLSFRQMSNGFFRYHDAEEVCGLSRLLRKWVSRLDLRKVQDETKDLEKEKEPEVNKKKIRNFYFCVANSRYFSVSIYSVINKQN